MCIQVQSKDECGRFMVVERVSKRQVRDQRDVQCRRGGRTWLGREILSLVEVLKFLHSRGRQSVKDLLRRTICLFVASRMAVGAGVCSMCLGPIESSNHILFSCRWLFLCGKLLNFGSTNQCSTLLLLVIILSSLWRSKVVM